MSEYFPPAQPDFEDRSLEAERSAKEHRARQLVAVAARMNEDVRLAAIISVGSRLGLDEALIEAAWAPVEIMPGINETDERIHATDETMEEFDPGLTDLYENLLRDELSHDHYKIYEKKTDQDVIEIREAILTALAHGDVPGIHLGGLLYVSNDTKIIQLQIDSFIKNRLVVAQGEGYALTELGEEYLRSLRAQIPSEE